EYLDDPKFWPILEAAEGLDACIYLHPRSPSDGFAAPLRHYGLNAVWGFATETGTHAVRMIMSGLFDRFPRLRFCLGHMGEGIHFWFWRLDFLQASLRRAGRGVPLEHSPSEYFKRNFVITTSGQESHPALGYSIEVLGGDSVLWAIDYPYQPTDSAVAFMDSAPISEEDREKIYHLNAERVFRLPSS
ncbi:MAG TPA: amidohydrolase family protein, partial [Acidimicrobiales bacterium]|nr:amidohydrolase family protein [Acidimicrobiales bacterium]